MFQQISGQEALSYGTSCHRLFAPLWPSSLGISDSCQYTTVPKRLTNQNSLKTGQSIYPFSLYFMFVFHLMSCFTSVLLCAGKCCYSPDFLLQMRFSPAACVRPVDLKLIPGVTDIIPGKKKPTIIHKCFSCS